MKTIIAITIIVFSSLLASAQAPESTPLLQKTQKQIVCGPAPAVFRELLQEYQEKPYWSGDEPENSSKYILMVNVKTGSWTIVQSNGAVACILGTGENHTPIYQSVV